MHADCAFYKGMSHDTCQDYARIVQANGKSYAIVSDGCSSSADTDVGARLLTIATGNIIENHPHPRGDHFFECAAHLAKAYIQGTGLPETALDATLLMLSMEDGKVIANFAGDGFFCVKLVSGDRLIGRLEFAENHPYYLTYSLDSRRKSLWAKKVTSKSGGKPLTIDSTTFYGGTRSDTRFSVYDFIYNREWDADQVEWAAVMSDGVGTFSKKDDDGRKVPIDHVDVITDLTDFKTHKGKFVQRRCNSFMKKVVKEGWMYEDDVSIAVLCTGD